MSSRHHPEIDIIRISTTLYTHKNTHKHAASNSHPKTCTLQTYTIYKNALGPRILRNILYDLDLMAELVGLYGTEKDIGLLYIYMHPLVGQLICFSWNSVGQKCYTLNMGVYNYTMVHNLCNFQYAHKTANDSAITTSTHVSSIVMFKFLWFTIHFRFLSKSSCHPPYMHIFRTVCMDNHTTNPSLKWIDYQASIENMNSQSLNSPTLRKKKTLIYYICRINMMIIRRARTLVTNSWLYILLLSLVVVRNSAIMCM